MSRADKLFVDMCRDILDNGYSSEGLGIARVNGAVVFVPHAVRGEEIDLRITKVMKTSCAGEIVKIHNPSPERLSLIHI